MEGSEKNSFDALMSLADFRLKRAFDRRNYEWKVTLAVWALFAAAIGNPLPKEFSNVTLIIVVAISFVHIFFWIRHHWDRSTIDLRVAFWFAEIAERKFSFKESPPERLRPEEMKGCEKWIGFLFSPVCFAQAFTTAVLGGVVIYRAWTGN
jgi:hypothetical protein